MNDGLDCDIIILHVNGPNTLEFPFARHRLHVYFRLVSREAPPAVTCGLDVAGNSEEDTQ